jgi:hypothetical protein
MAPDAMTATALDATMNVLRAPVPDTLPRRELTGAVVVATGRRDQQRSRWIPTLSSAWCHPTAVDRPVVAVAPHNNETLRDGMRELLFALGKDPHVTGAAFKDEGNLDVPAAWLLARGTREVIVRDANLAGAPLLRALLELAVGVGARIWLIAHQHRDDDLDEIAEVWAAHRIDLDQFDVWWSRPERRPQRTRRPIDTLAACDLPASAALTFRADCRRWLSADRFAEVDALYVAEFTTALEEFQARATLPHEAIAARLRARVREQREPWQVLTVARAIEAAAFRCGFDIDIDHHQLINAAERNPRPGRLGVDEHAAIDAYSKPSWAAAVAVAACEAGFEDICELSIDSIDDDAAVVDLGDATLDVPATLRPYLVAARLERIFEGAQGADALVINRHNVRVRPQWISKVLRITEVETGVRLTKPRGNRRRITTDDWCVAHGVSIRTIHNGATRRRKRT